MRIDTGQSMRLDQRLKLAPRMIQSMEILQLASIALEERIEQELSSNPTLELREFTADAEEIDAELKQAERDDREGERELVVDEGPDASNNVDDFERLTNLSEEYSDSWDANTYSSGESYRPARYDGERDRKLDAMANTAARPPSLNEQLVDQWTLSELSEGRRELGEYLLSCVDADGYLRTPAETLLSNAPAGTTLDTLEETIGLLQDALEPVGLAARNVRECLLLQINARDEQARREGQPSDFTLERRLVSNHLDDLSNNRLPRIAKALDISLDQLKQAIARLRGFHLHPGRLLADDAAPMITPDAIIEYDEEEDRYIALLCQGRGASLQISPQYLEMVSDKSLDRKTRDFIGNNLRSARWLIDAIAQRDQTLLRVINVVLDAQREFFDQGPQALKPLPMTQVADQLGIHVATVSRAVSEKYIQTSRGMFPLRMFFSGGTETEAGDAMSWAAIQAKLEEIISDEDKQDPLNDDQLVEKLKAAGIDIARRTVAKYRKQLNIPPARQRREF